MASRGRTSRCHDRDSTEFGRVLNLSDGVFAIALTLLVLGLVVPDGDGDQLAGALRDLVPNFIAFALAFSLVANIWWLHHNVFAALRMIEPGMMAINIVGLAGVALAPFPTSLVGNHPAERAAVLPFLALSTVWLLFVLRANHVGAWRRPLSAVTFRWILLDWAASLGALVFALVVALVYPLAALGIVSIGSGVAWAATSRLGPDRSEWF